ncbi:LppM family (lipo)protein [Haloglycomyces albus]|uniref:LppM family (lipo)protein n=1 Tax=Haloglycomyces albus TaxID=526067 RepID=UPI00046CCC0E|nr:hypothetical protein [Haloglycomyces albus]
MSLPRRYAALTMTLGLVFALTACVHANAAVDLRADNTASGSITVMWDGDLWQQTSVNDSEMTPRQFNGFVNGVIESVPYQHRESIHRHGLVGQRVSFHNIPIDAMHPFITNEMGNLSVSRSERTWVAEGYWNLKHDSTATLPPGLNYQVAVTFPANVAEHNGTLEGRTVTWVLEPGQEYRLHARAVQFDGGRITLIALSLSIAVLGALWAWQLHRLSRYSLRKPGQGF